MAVLKKIEWWKSLTRKEKEMVARKCSAYYTQFQGFSNMMYHPTKVPLTRNLAPIFRIIRKLAINNSEKLIPHDFDPSLSKKWTDWPK